MFDIFKVFFREVTCLIFTIPWVAKMFSMALLVNLVYGAYDTISIISGSLLHLMPQI